MPKNLSVEIKQRLLASIQEGRYRPGSLLPPIRTLAGTFKVSTKTVQKAVNALSGEGLIEAKPGKGLFVRSGTGKTKRSRKIVVPMPYSDQNSKEPSGFPGGAITALRQGLKNAGYNVAAVPLSQMEELAIINHIRDLNPAAIILCEVDSDHLITELRQLMLPMISMDYNAFHLGISSVIFDNLWSGFEATQLLISQGHRHIVGLHPQYRRSIGGNAYVDSVEEHRLDGYRLAMMNAGFKPRVDIYAPGNEPMRMKLLELFGCRPSPTALFCKNDGQALFITRELMSMGYRIPEDVSLVAFGASGSEFAPGKKVTSVWNDCEGMGRTAAEFLLSELKEKTDYPKLHRLPTRIEMGDSVAPAPGQ